MKRTIWSTLCSLSWPPFAFLEFDILSEAVWQVRFTGRHARRWTSTLSANQWDDVSRLIRLLGDAADFDYLKHAAESVGVFDLLEELLKQP